MFGKTEKFATSAQELAHLSFEAQRGYVLQEKAGTTQEQAAAEVIERYAAAQATDFLHETKVLPAHEAEKIVLRLRPEAHDRQIEELFGIMLEKGVKNALDVAAKLGSSHLEDDFHRFLVQYLHTIGALPGLKEDTPLSRELQHSLFSVTLPPLGKEQSEAPAFKRFIQAMKQFLSGMLAISDAQKGEYYTLELAVQHSSRNISLYVSVPRTHIATFEKLVHAYYPGAAIEEAIDDYNIFAPTGGGIAAATASLAEPAILPLSTDESFEHDPLAALITSLSRLQEEGEGAAIQVLITSDDSNANKLFQSVIDSAEKTGDSVVSIYKEATASLIKGVGKGLLDLFKTEKKEPEEEKKELKLDTVGIELAKKKNQSHTISAGIRIIASGATLARAQSILAAIKASFNQFSVVGGNRIEWRDIKAAHLPLYARSFSFRTLQKSEQLLLTTNELATLFHFPMAVSASPDLREAPAAAAPAPRTRSDGGITLGTNEFQGETTEVSLSKEDRMRHVYVIGQTGTGKSTILKNMAIQDIKAGSGVCFIDPHGSDLDDILANIPAERLDDARPMGLNMLEYNEAYPEQKIFVINELLAIFNKLFDMKVAGGPAFEQYFRNAAGLVMEDPASGSTLLEIGRVMTDKAFRELKLSRCKNPIIKQFWENAEKATGEASLANFVPYITNKFDVFVSNDIMRPVIAQQESVLNFREIMDKKKILLVNLSKGRLGDINSSLIGLVLVGKLSMAALSRADIIGKEAINDFYLYIDEFQNVTTDSIATILSEARKYRLSLTMAHQYIEQLQENIRDAVFGNVGSMVVYRVSPENAAVLEKQLAPTFSASDITKLQNFNAYAKILVGGVPEKPFNLRIPPPPKGDPSVAEKMK